MPRGCLTVALLLLAAAAANARARVLLGAQDAQGVEGALLAQVALGAQGAVSAQGTRGAHGGESARCGCNWLTCPGSCWAGEGPPRPEPPLPDSAYTRLTIRNRGSHRISVVVAFAWENDGVDWNHETFAAVYGWYNIDPGSNTVVYERTYGHFKDVWVHIDVNDNPSYQWQGSDYYKLALHSGLTYTDSTGKMRTNVPNSMLPSIAQYGGAMYSAPVSDYVAADLRAGRSLLFALVPGLSGEGNKFFDSTL